MRRFCLRTVFFFTVFLLVFALLCGGFCAFSVRHTGSAPTSEGTSADGFRTIVLDAGHGGEDGGTVGVGGILEKDVNLSVVLLLRDLLTEKGYHVVLTRSTDTMLYDPASDYKGRKKALDLAARRQIGEAHPDALFVSIHMNSFPQSQYKGLQIWYSPNDPRSRAVADSMRDTVREILQPENKRETKAATRSIYLLYYLTTPAVLVECGFLSNPEEAALLSTEEYRERLALTLCEAIVRVSSQNAENSEKRLDLRGNLLYN